jgi:hypothetical protein
MYDSETPDIKEFIFAVVVNAIILYTIYYYI